MLLKATVIICVLAYTTAIVPVTYPKYCSECEDEIWEEVPCDLIPTTSTTTTTTSRPTTAVPITPYVSTTTTTAVPPSPPYTHIVVTTTVPPITTTSTRRPYYPTAAPHYITTTPSPPVGTTEVTGSDAFKKCYCECKVGCKDFCRKVVINTDPKQHITQISKTSDSVAQGAVEVTHLHERKYLPAVPSTYGSSYSSYPKPQPILQPLTLPAQQPGNGYPVEASLELDSLYESAKPIYNAPAPAVLNEKPSNYYSSNPIDHSGYSIDELTQLLHSEDFGKASYTNPSQIYYSQASAPSYPYAPEPAQYFPAPVPAPGSVNQYAPAPAPVKQYAPAPAPVQQYAIPPAPPAPTPAPNPNYAPRYSEVKTPAKQIIKASATSSSSSGITPVVPQSPGNYVSKTGNPANAPNTNEPSVPLKNPAFDYAVNNYLNEYVYTNQKPSSGGFAPYHGSHTYSISYA